MPTCDVPGARLHYLDEGGGDPPVVLLHAFPLSAAMWEPQLEALAGRSRVVAPDLVGFGRSDVPPERGDYSVERWSDDVAGLLGALDLGPVVLVGLSMGGYAAFAFWRRHRSSVRGLVLADTRPGADDDRARARRVEQQELLSGGASLDAMAERLLTPLVGPTSTRREEVLATARRLLGANRPEGVAGALEALKNRPDSTPTLAGIDVPTLVVVGAQDQLSPPDVARDMARRIPGAALEVVADAGHLSNLENPASFDDALLGFLSGL